MAKGQGSGSAVIYQGAPVRPKGFIEAISQIERFHELEMEGGSIPPGLFSTDRKIEFWEVGFISTFLSGLISIVMVPLAIGVIERMIPVFGGDEPKLFDQFLVLSLALSFTVGYAAFLGQLGRYYGGEYTKVMIRCFMGGVALSAVLKIVIAVIFYHTLYFIVLDPVRLGRWLLALRGWIGGARIAAAYGFLLEFRGVLLTSAWFIAATSIVYVVYPAGRIWMKILSDRKMEREGGRRL